MASSPRRSTVQMMSKKYGPLCTKTSTFRISSFLSPISCILSSSYRNLNALLLVLLVLSNVPQVPAPVPRCSPFIIINKLAEWSNLKSDSNPYFPVPPCEYGGPIQAIKAKDYEAVFVFAHPERIPLHNIYEFVWFWKTGLPRLIRVLLGKQEYVYDKRILFEGFQHHTKYPRTKKIGFKTHRDPSFINNKDKWKATLKHKKQVLFTRGPDKFDPHEDVHGSGFYYKPNTYWDSSHGITHNSHQRNELLLSNSIAQVQPNQPSQASFNQFSQPATFQTFHRPSHIYNNAYKTSFVSSEPETLPENIASNSFSPIRGINEVTSTSSRRKENSFKFPDESKEEIVPNPAISTYNYGDRISKKRRGLYSEHSNEEGQPRQFRQKAPTKSTLQQISQHSKFPSIGDQIDLGQSFQSNNDRLKVFSNHKHPSFSQTAGGKLPSFDKVKQSFHPHKLLTSDPGGNQNNYGQNGHNIDGSRKRRLLAGRHTSRSRLKPDTSFSLKENSQSRKNKRHRDEKGNAKQQTVLQYLFSKMG